MGNFAGNAAGNLAGKGNLAGNSVGNLVGNSVGNSVGNLAGNSVGNLVGNVVGQGGCLFKKGSDWWKFWGTNQSTFSLGNLEILQEILWDRVDGTKPI